MCTELPSGVVDATLDIGHSTWVGQRGNQPRRGCVQLGEKLAGPLFLMCLICSCGSPSISSSEVRASVPGTVPPPTGLPTTAPELPRTENLPATTVFGMPARDDALVASIKPTRVTEPCPDSPSGPDGTGDMQAEVARLEPMLGQVLAYGGQHADEFGSYGLIWQAVDDASVFISFTSNLDVHRDALNDLVSYPDELIVCQVAVSGDVARALMAKLTDDLQGHFGSVGLGMGGVEIVLMPGEQALANELVATYGDAVEVTVCADAAACTATLD
jgi:hypothetical protein